MVYWLFFSTLVVVWDASFLLLRPASMPDGPLGMGWAFAYRIYLAIDHSYADLANTTAEALAVMSVLEACGVFVALWADQGGRGRLAHLLAMVVVSLTSAKTMLFILIEGMHGWSYIDHNEWLPLLFGYVIPNGLWIVMPAFVAIHLGRTIGAALGETRPGEMRNAPACCPPKPKAFEMD